MTDKTSESPAAGGPEKEVTRRDVHQDRDGAAIAVPLVNLTTAARAAVLRSRRARRSLFFTKRKFALSRRVDRVIIRLTTTRPAPARGGHRVHDARLAEAFVRRAEADRALGLKTIERSPERSTAVVSSATPEQRVALLTRISQNESRPRSRRRSFSRS